MQRVVRVRQRQLILVYFYCSIFTSLMYANIYDRQYNTVNIVIHYSKVIDIRVHNVNNSTKPPGSPFCPFSPGKPGAPGGP